MNFETLLKLSKDFFFYFVNVQIFSFPFYFLGFQEKSRCLKIMAEYGIEVCPELSFYFCLLLKSYFMETGKLSDWKGHIAKPWVLIVCV